MSPLNIRTLDLSASEKAVFDVLKNQKLGRDISKIAKDANIPRTTAAYILKKFRNRKIVRKVGTEKRGYWLYNKMLDRTN